MPSQETETAQTPNTVGGSGDVYKHLKHLILCRQRFLCEFEKERD